MLPGRAAALCVRQSRCATWPRGLLLAKSGLFVRVRLRVTARIQNVHGRMRARLFDARTHAYMHSLVAHWAVSGEAGGAERVA